jgi:hypothetical protein
MATMQINQLVDSLCGDVQLAKLIVTPNPEDDLAIKTAIVGFCYSSDIRDWAKQHYIFVNERLVRDYNSEELAHYGENSENVKLYYALCIGYLLGLYSKERITDKEFSVAERQIPGFIMLHLSKITSLALE